MDDAENLNRRDRVQLDADGYEPVEVWTRKQRGKPFWEEVLAEASEIARGEDEADLNLFMEFNWRDMCRLIEEQEEAQQSETDAAR